MKNLYRWWWMCLIIVVNYLSIQPTQGQINKELNNEPTNIYLFHSEGCPHCEKEIAWLNNLQNTEKNLQIYNWEVSKNKTNQNYLRSVSSLFASLPNNVPVTIVGETMIIGFDSHTTTGTKILASITAVRQGDQMDLVANHPDPQPPQSILPEVADFLDDEIISPALCTGDNTTDDGTCALNDSANTVSIPWLGAVNLEAFSLPLLTVVVAFLDGFNPCAMWVLIFLITMLFRLENRWRMWWLGSVFILFSGIMYFFILTAWLQLFLFLGWVTWIRMGIGMLALGAGGWYLYDSITNPSGQCKVAPSLGRSKILAVLQDFVQRKSLILATIGVAILAVGVNMIEAICSAGLPAIYTQTLALSGLEIWQFYGYLLLYILIFMLDDLLIFAIAMITLRHTTLGSKYAHYSHLVGSVILLVLGLMLIFKPEWLMFA